MPSGEGLELVFEELEDLDKPEGEGGIPRRLPSIGAKK